MWNRVNAIPEDNRGVKCPKNKTPDSKKEEILLHIKKFPAYESHYARSHTSKQYLQVGLNVKKMHKLYTTETLNPASLKVYHQVFKQTGLKFKKPQLDQCHKCDVFNAKLKYESDDRKKDEILKLQEAHHEAAELAYESKRKDKETAKSLGGKHIVCSFDLQQCLPTPSLQTSVTFYKRQLWTYNLTVNNITTAETTCFMWHEAEGKRGGNEIASCLQSFLENLDPQVEHVTLYSDNCVGQNKNKIVSGMLTIVVHNHETLKTVDHKFLEFGHTHMECDSDHALIERAKKLCPEIHHPEDWYSLVRNCKSKKMNVVVMTKDDFYNYEKLYKTKLISRSKNAAGGRFLWQPIEFFRYTKEQGVVYYKCNFLNNGAFDSFDLRRKSNVIIITKDDAELCYSDPLPLSREKKEDLLSIINLIRPDVHSFYQNLPCVHEKSDKNIDPDLDNYLEVEETVNTDAIEKDDSHHKPKKLKGQPDIVTPETDKCLRKSKRLAQKPKITYKNLGNDDQ